jgi:hypothetical protein
MRLGIASEPEAATRDTPERSRAFDWPLAHEAERLLRAHLQSFLKRNRFALELSERMKTETATDLFEWVDHLVLPGGLEAELEAAGFSLRADLETPNGEAVYEQLRATLPRVLIRRGSETMPVVVAVRPESISNFIARQNLEVEPEGEPFSRYRRSVVAEENGTRLEAVERNGYLGFVPALLKSDELSRILKAKELWSTRRRRFADEADGFKVADELCDRIVRLVGRDLACQFFFESERAYWESRNFAGRTQRCRQERLGLGWGNHDHHTFRCSRAHFRELIAFLLKLGFTRRERYYAGSEAGWGAQILEQPVARIVVFADVDLMPEEIEIDFSTHPLPVASRLGTVGLWVALHGESFLEAGMHHLEARFDFDALRHQLQQCGLGMMKPFSDFEFLRQAFTEGERWPVSRSRLERLLSERLITEVQFDQFFEHGAVGSHLENLQRHGGFKGFNQKSVSAIIAATDPRTMAPGAS